MLQIEKNYGVLRSNYQALFYEISETFVQYINTLTADEIDQLDTDLRLFDMIWYWEFFSYFIISKEGLH